MRNEINLREVRARIGYLVERAEHAGEITIITRHGHQAAAIVPIHLIPQEQAMTVTLYETNSDILVIARGDDAWTLQVAGTHMVGRFAADAEAWINGDWEPNEGDGQNPTHLDDLKEVATWDAENGVTLLVDPDSLGGAAREYLPATATTDTTQIAEHQQGRGGYSYPLAVEVAELLGVAITEANDEVLTMLRQFVDADGPAIVLDRRPVKPELVGYNPNDLDVDHWLTVSQATADEIREAIAAQHESETQTDM